MKLFPPLTSCSNFAMASSTPASICLADAADAEPENHPVSIMVTPASVAMSRSLREACLFMFIRSFRQRRRSIDSMICSSQELYGGGDSTCDAHAWILSKLTGGE